MNNHSYKGIYIDGGFTPIPRYVTRRRHPLSWSAQLVYLHLRDHCDVNRRCWPSIATLCFECGGLGRNTVVRAIRELESMNLVERYHRYNHETKATMSNGYIVMDTPSKDSDVDATTLPDWEPLETPDEEIPMTRQDTAPHPEEYTPNASTVHEVEPFKDSHLKITNTPIAPKGQETEQPTFEANEDSTEDNPVESTPIDQPASFETYDDGEYTPDFEMFWAMYPLHQDKRQAFKAYKRARRRASAMVIAAGAQKYASDPNLPEPRYIKHAATWLNADGWANDPLPSRTSVNGRPNRAESTFNNAVNIAKQFYEQEYGSAPQDTNLLGGLQ